MTLRELAAEDIGLFFNTDDFAETATVNEISMPVVVDGDQLARYRREGVFEGTLLLYARAADFAKVPNPGEALIFNKAKLWVESCKNELGILEIVLNQARPR